MDRKILGRTFISSFLAVLYVFLVSRLMIGGEQWFGNQSLAPFAILLLFSLSAAVMGGLVFGQAALLFLDGQRKESIKSAFFSVGWLALFTALVFGYLVVSR